MRFDATSQLLVTGKPPQLDQRLPFEWCGVSADAVILLELLERCRPGAGIAVWPQPQIDTKHTVAARLDQPHDLMSQCFKKLAMSVVHEKQFKVGCVTHFAAAEFSKREQREWAVPYVVVCRMSESTRCAHMADSSRFFHHSFGKVGESLREFRWRAIRQQQVADIDEKQLPVLESVQHGFLVVGGCGVQRCPQFTLHHASAVRRGVGFDQWNHFVEMNPEKVVPQVVTRPQQTGQPAHPFRARQERERAIVKRFIAKLDKLVEKLIEMMHCLRGIGCLRYETRELHDHSNGERQPFLLRAFCDLAAGMVADDEAIMGA